jgi:acyl-CoA thioester hydrolase
VDKEHKKMGQVLHDADGKVVVETRFRVRYHETDAMGIVHHAAYITWFEEGRSAFTRAIGYPYAEMEADGISLAVADLAARYQHAAHYDDEIIVSTCLSALRSRGMTFTYTVRRASDGVVLASGKTDMISVDSSGRVKRFPETVRHRLMGHGEPVAQSAR